MEGPTPVSALIHAATLVTAGVYLMLRVSPLLEYASTTVIAMAFVGAITAIFAATSGIAQTDIKRVIAYSTCSQVGYMFMSLGLGHYNLALYHLANHACFKAMLFMAAGSVIHAFLDQQDLRRYGGLVQVMPVVYSALVIGSLSLMAVPYMTGWYSKDGILEVAVGSYTVPGIFVYIVGTVVAGLTAYYSVRLVVLTFLTEPRSDFASYNQAHDATVIVMVPLVVLSLLSIMLGYVSSDLFRGIGTDMLAVSSPTNPSMVASVDAEFAGITLYKLAPFIATVTGSLLAYWGYNTAHGVEAMTRLFRGVPMTSLYGFLNAQWQFDALIISGVIVPALRLGHSLSKVFDRGILEALGPYGLQRNFTASGSTAVVYSTGVLTDYAMYIVLAMLAGVVFFALPTIGLMGVDGIAMALLINGVSAYLVSKGSET